MSLIMRRTLAVLGWILLGALASGVSLGYYLNQANGDRQWLSLRANSLQEENQSALDERDRKVSEADQKAQDAKVETDKMRSLLQACEDRNARLVKAVILNKPDSRTLKTWTESVSVTLGVSLRLPPGLKAYDLGTSLEVNQPATNASGTTVLAIYAYDPTHEQQLSQDLVDTDAVSYSINGALATGIRGHQTGSTAITFLLRIGADRVPTQLIYAKTYDKITESKILDILSTLVLRS